MAFRTDRSSLSLSDLRPPQQRADGSWLYDAIVTRAGVFEYELEGGGKRREWRPPDEVSRPESLETLQLAPVVIGEHTPKGEARKVSVGSVGESVRWDGTSNSVFARVVVRDDMALRKIREGMHEVSCGYEVDLEETPGTTPDGERYDAIQRGMPRADGSRGPIVYEHLAIVPSGRQGPQVALRADSATSKLQRRRSWRVDAAHQTASASAPGGAAASTSPAALSRSKDRDMAVTGKTRGDCGMDEKTDGMMPPAPGAAPGAAPSPEDKLKALMAENAALKERLAKMGGAQDAPANPAQPAPRALDSADEDDDDMPVAQDSKGRMDAMDVLVSRELDRREIVARATKLGVTVLPNSRIVDVKRAVVEHFDGQLPKERFDSLSAKARDGYISAMYDVVIKRVESSEGAEVAARAGRSDRQDSSSVKYDAVTAAFLDQQKRNDARSQRGSK